MKYWKRLIVVTLVLPLLVFSVLVGALYRKQQSVVQELVELLNKDFDGTLSLGGSHISPFANFPYISIDLEQVKVFEDKSKTTTPLLAINDIYLGFNLLDILRGKYDIQSIKLKDGFISLVQHTDGSFNISNALSSPQEIEDVNEEFHLNLKSIQLVNIDLLKLNEETNILFDFFVHEAQSKFMTSPNHVMVALESTFQLNLIIDGDTTFVHHKHFDLSTQLDFVSDQQRLIIQPSVVMLEQARFSMKGSVDIDDDMNLDILFEGEKTNFDLLTAFAPEELIPTIKRYENGGKVYFRSAIKGKSVNGHTPSIEADFGCEAAFFDNKDKGKKLDELFFKGHFTNGEQRNATTMEFSLEDVSAKPEAGIFTGSLMVRNFQSPEIDLKIRSEFELDFLANFLNFSELEGLKGSVALTMNFHDIIDLSNPEKSVEKMNESYFTELDVRDLSFTIPNYHVPIQNVTIKASMAGHQATLEKFNFKIGNSDIRIQGTISDLPAILHQKDSLVEAVLTVESKLLDIHELTAGDTINKKPINEQIRDFQMKLSFRSSAHAFTKSPNLPVGEFFIEDLYAKLTHYPHVLHDFHADVFIDNNDFRIIDFTGMIDKSDFHFTGKLNNYNLWFNQQPLGNTNMEFNLTSTLLQLEDLFSYGGENYVPEDYRHEEFKNLKIHGFASLHFDKGLKSTDITIDRLETSAKIHPLRFEKFNGRARFADEHLTIDELSGKIGRSEFTTQLTYYLGSDDAVRKRDNSFSLVATQLDLDELFNYTPLPANKATPEAHESGFNIFELPFTDMSVSVAVDQLNYHRFQLNKINAVARIQKNHYLYIDTVSLVAAGGSLGLKGYMNGSDKNKIYFSPTLSVENIDLDKLFFKFENFGQDHLVSENLHGKLSGQMKGKIHMHADMIPIIDDSQITMDFEVTHGRLENYPSLDALAEYFKDKNLKKVIFDTLRNQIDIDNGKVSIPKMTINSSLGFIEISGWQDLEMNMEYYVRIPLKLVTQIGVQKLFGEKNEVDPDAVDEIQYKDASKKIRFINLKITGTPDTYQISMGKDKRGKK